MEKEVRAFIIKTVKVTFGLFAVNGVVVDTARIAQHFNGKKLQECLKICVANDYWVLEVFDTGEPPVPVNNRLLQSLLKSARH